jgi:hypothetical protein
LRSGYLKTDSWNRILRTMRRAKRPPRRSL